MRPSTSCCSISSTSAICSLQTKWGYADGDYTGCTISTSWRQRVPHWIAGPVAGIQGSVTVQPPLAGCPQQRQLDGVHPATSIERSQQCSRSSVTSETTIRAVQQAMPASCAPGHVQGGTVLCNRVAHLPQRRHLARIGLQRALHLGKPAREVRQRKPEAVLTLVSEK